MTARKDSSNYTLEERRSYNREYRQQVSSKRCDCGKPAVKKDGAGWVCQSCLDFEARHFTGSQLNDKVTAGVKEPSADKQLTRAALRQVMEPFKVAGFSFGRGY